MFPDVPVFDAIRDNWPDRVTAWDLGKRPVRVRRSDASMLDPETAIVADCSTSEFRALLREHPNRDAAEEIAEEMHQRDLERAAQPPVIEVTVTTPPEGMPRAELTQIVSQTVAKFTGPQPVLPSRRRKVLQAIRRPRKRVRGPLPDVPTLPVSEDDIPTQVLGSDVPPGFELVEVRVP